MDSIKKLDAITIDTGLEVTKETFIHPVVVAL